MYRQIASLMGLQLVTSFITVAKTLGTLRETTQRQLNAEEKKKKPEESRVQSLKKRVETAHAQITFIDDIIQKKMFHGYDPLV